MSTTSVNNAKYMNGYPTPFRFGHRYETSVGQRLAVDGLFGPIDLVMGPDHRMYVLCRAAVPTIPRNRIMPVDIEDEYGEDIIPIIEGKPQEPGNEFLPSPVMCVIDSDGVIFVTDEHVNLVSMFRYTGETVGWWGESGDKPGQFNAPAGIALDSDENLWISESRNHRIQKFTRSGEYLGGFGEFGTEPGQFNYPWGIAIDPINGTILVADWRNDRIQRFTTAGELVQIIGSSGSGVGELKRPSSVTVDKHGDIYVSDRGNNRVLLFNPRGMFIESFRGDAQITEKGYKKLLANPDALRFRDNVVNLDVEKRFLAPNSVKVDDEGLVYIVDTGRFRVQIYRNPAVELTPDMIDPPEMHPDPVVY